MSTNKKFRIQNGLDVTGEVVVGGVTVINADGTVVSDVSDQLVPLQADVAALETSIANILGTSPETLDTLQELVAAYESADADLTVLVTQTSQAVADLENSVGAGAALTVTSDPTAITYTEQVNAPQKYAFPMIGGDKGLWVYDTADSSWKRANGYGGPDAVEPRVSAISTKWAVFGDAHAQGSVAKVVVFDLTTDMSSPAWTFTGTREQFASSVAVDGDALFVGQFNGTNSIYRYDLTTGLQTHTFTQPNIGRTMKAANGKVVAVTYAASGSSKTYVLNGDDLSIENTVMHSAWTDHVHTNGQYIGVGDNNNSVIAINDTHVFLGNKGHKNPPVGGGIDSGTSNSGAVHILELATGQTQTITNPEGLVENAKFGISVAILENYLVVGASEEQGYQFTGDEYGQIHVFDLSDMSLVKTIDAKTDPLIVDLMPTEGSYTGHFKQRFAHYMSGSGNSVLVFAREALQDHTDNQVYDRLYSINFSDIDNVTASVFTAAGAPDGLEGRGRFGELVEVTPTTLIDQPVSDTIVPNSGVVPAINYLEDKTNDMQTEINALTGQDTSLSTSIDANTAAITAETARAQAAESANWNAIQSEITRATTVEDANTSAISDESIARAAGDSALQDQIDAIVGTSPATLDTLQEIVAAFEGADSDLQTLMTANASSVSSINETMGNVGDVVYNQTTIGVMPAGGWTSGSTVYKMVQHAYSPVDVTDFNANMHGLFRGIADANGGVHKMTFLNNGAPLFSYEATGGQSFTWAENASGQKYTNEVWILASTSTITSTTHDAYGSVPDATTTVGHSFKSFDEIQLFKNGSVIGTINLLDGSISGLHTVGYSLVGTVDNGLTLETTATTVFGAVNELHTELQTLAGLDTSIVGDVSANTQAIADEVARATAAEASLSTSISNESTARNTAVSGLQSQVTSNASAITAEESRALAAEAGLATQIAAESTARDSAISAEASLREAGDAALQAAIDASVSTTDLSVSGTATFEGGINVGSNGGSIGYDDTSEDIQMMSDVDMQGNLIHNLGAPVDATDAASKSYVDGQISNIIGGSVGSLDTIQEVVAAFESADSDIQGLIAANTANHATNATAISAESTARQTADTTLQGNIDAETSARSAADSDLQASIDAEVARATAAETVNATNHSSLDTFVKGSGPEIATSEWTEGSPVGGVHYISTPRVVLPAGTWTFSSEWTGPAGIAPTFFIMPISWNGDGMSDMSEALFTSGPQPANGSYTETFSYSQDVQLVYNATLTDSNQIGGSLTTYTKAELVSADGTPLETTATQVVPAINEVLAAVNSSSTASASDLAAETAARIAGDSDITASLAGETAARIAGDGSLQSQIDAVESAVQAITSGSVASLDTLVEVVSAFENADSDLQALMTANSSSISGVDTRVGTLETEMDAVEGVASANASLLSTHSSSIAGLDSDVSSLQSFTGQGTVLGTAAVSLAAAINEIHNELNSVVADLGVETARAAAKENSLDSDINDETAARIAGDAGLQSQIDSLSTSLTDEGTGRDSDVASLQSQINSIVSNTDSAALDSLTEIVAAFQSADGSLSQLITNNQTDITSHNTRIGVIEAWTTDNLPEGSVNKYFNDSDVKACLSGGLCIDYNASTGVIAIDEVEAASSLKTAESFASDDASKLEGQDGSYYRIDVYDINGSVVN